MNIQQKKMVLKKLLRPIPYNVSYEHVANFRVEDSEGNELMSEQLLSEQF